MNTPLLVAVISAAAGIFASAFTFFLTKKKERDAEWRKQKLETYKDLLAAMSGSIGRQATAETRKRFAATVNNLYLVGSPPVLVAMRTLLDEMEVPNKITADRHDSLLTELMYEIRDDLGIRPNRANETYKFKLWTPGSDSH